MQVNVNKKKRISLKYWNFYFSFFYTFLCLLFYLFAKYVIPLPTKWFLGNAKKISPIHLFSSGISFHLQVSIVVNSIFSFYKSFFLNKKNRNNPKIELLRFNLSKFLKSNLFSLFGLYLNWKFVDYSYYSIIITYLTFFASNCLLDIIIDTISDHGVCNGFNLIFFVEAIPFKWFEEVSNLLLNDKIVAFQVLMVFLMTLCFIWISDLKWEIPVETNSISFNNNELLKINSFNRSNFGFKINFGLMNMIQLSLALKILYALFNTFFSQSIHYHRENFLASKWKNFVSSDEKIKKVRVDSDNFWESFIALNNSSGLFRNFFSNSSKENSKFLQSLFCLLLFSHFINWFSIYNFQIKPEEISEDLKKNGFYFNGIPSGKYTKILISKIANKLIIIWTIFIITMNFLFDQIFTFSVTKSNPSFFNWFNGVISGVEIFKQIKNKYEYIRSYD